MNGEAVFVKCARRLLPFIFILYLVNFIDRVNVGFAALTMNKDLAFSAGVFGLGAGSFFAGYSLFQIPANLILQRFGARRWIFLILLVWGAVSASNALVTGPSSFYAVRTLLGVAEAGFFPGMVLYLTYWFPKAYRARLVSNFMLAIPFANMVGGPVSGFILGMDGILGLHGWQWLFLMEGAPACVLAFVVLVYLPSGPAEASWLNAEEKLTIAARLKDEDRSQHRDFGATVADPHVWALGAVYLGYSISYYGVQLWLPQIVKAMGFSNFATTLLVSLPFAATMIAMFYWGRSSDASGERIWHVAIPALAAMTGLIAASVSGSNLIVFLALSLAVMSLMSLQGPFWALPQSYLSGTAAAGGIALINTIGTGAGGFIGPNIVGVLVEVFGGYSVAMAVLALAPMMTALVVLSLKKSVAPKAVLT